MTSRIDNIAGLDEVGRGSLFGPVFAAAVILDNLSEVILRGKGLRDSKKLTSKKRAYLVPLIKKNCLAWAIGQASSREIDQIGIRDATEKAMLRALKGIKEPIEMIIVDGVLPIKDWGGPQQTLIKGDEKNMAIAAASVLAKESRDSLIKRLSKRFPEYGLDKNVGYGTKHHRKIIAQLGPTSLHRKSFLSKIIR